MRTLFNSFCKLIEPYYQLTRLKRSSCNLALALALLTLATLLRPLPAQAQRLVFSEIFYGSLAKWEAPFGRPNDWYIGNGSLKVVLDRFETATAFVVKEEHWLPNWCQLKYQADIQLIRSGTKQGLIFNYQDEKNYSALYFSPNSTQIQRIKNSQVVFFSSHPYLLPRGQWVTFHFTFQDGYYTLIANDQLVALAHDATYTSADCGRIGLIAHTGDNFPAIFSTDNVKIYNLGPHYLPVPEFKQTDPRWGDSLYDHATSWSSNPSISRWGCALSSLAMILNAHGITRLWEGEKITPLSLNQWLREQPDGYIGEGLVNFLAVTRLTKQLSTHYRTPALEYGRLNYNETTKLAPAIAELQASRPLIVQIPGHFLVAEGVLNDGSDLIIKDPAYAYTKLGQHSTPPLSFRTFRPSFTDLSYLLFVTKADEELVITDPEGQSQSDSFTESLVAFDPHAEAGTEVEFSSPNRLWLVPKPHFGRYLITVNKSENGPFQIPVYRYDLEGKVAMDQMEGDYQGEPIQFALDFSNQAPPNVRLASSLSDWLELAHQFFREGKLGRPDIWLWLRYYAQAALNQEQAQELTVQVLTHVLNWYQDLIEPTAFTRLKTELGQLVIF